MKLVIIHWTDAFSLDDWTPIKKLALPPRSKDFSVKTVGWLSYDGDDFKTVISTLGNTNGSGVMSIPCGCIQSIQEMHIEPNVAEPEI